MTRRLSMAAACAVAITALVPAAARADLKCGDTITKSIVLTDDLVDCPHAGLIVAADDVTIDLGGHLIGGDGQNQEHDTGDGIHVEGHRNVTIRNGAIDTFKNGVFVDGAAGVRLQDVEAGGAWGSGVFVNNSSDVQLTDVPARGSAGADILVWDSRDVLVVQARTGNGDSNGLTIGGDSSHVTVRDSDLSGTDAGNGLAVGAATTDILLVDNLASGNRWGSGIVVASANTTLTGNEAVANDDLGIDAVAGVTDGGGNVAGGNGDPLECRGVACAPHPDYPPQPIDCGVTITKSVLLTRDLVCDGPGLIVGDSHLIVDLGGHTITGLTPADDDAAINGIDITRHSGVTIRNGTVRRFDIGINIAEGGDEVASMRVEDSWTAGISARDGHWSVIHGNTVVGSHGDGITVDEDGSTHVYDNVVDHNARHGISILGRWNLLWGNVATNNGGLGISATLETIDSGGNRAWGNRSPTGLQCQNIACADAPPPPPADPPSPGPPPAPPVVPAPAPAASRDGEAPSPSVPASPQVESGPSMVSHGDRVCTRIGCSSGVSLRISALKQRRWRAARTITACVNARCQRFVAKGDLVRIDDPRLSGEGPVRVRVVVRDQRGRVLMRIVRPLRLRRLQPNGPHCPPTCWLRTVRLDPAQRRLIATD